MPIPNEVTCPICGNRMLEIKDGRLELRMKANSLNETKQEINVRVFKCGSCSNLQYFSEIK